jgi:hypothetical protein
MPGEAAQLSVQRTACGTAANGYDSRSPVRIR